ncbi:Hypothetical predicted protein, partial [Marmota monax]
MALLDFQAHRRSPVISELACNCERGRLLLGWKRRGRFGDGALPACRCMADRPGSLQVHGRQAWLSGPRGLPSFFSNSSCRPWDSRSWQHTSSQSSPEPRAACRRLLTCDSLLESDRLSVSPNPSGPRCYSYCHTGPARRNMALDTARRCLAVLDQCPVAHLVHLGLCTLSVTQVSQGTQEDLQNRSRVPSFQASLLIPARPWASARGLAAAQGL